MNSLKKFGKNSKAISPIFATLILIAIAVIAGVVVYMFTSGTLATMTGGGTAAQEKVSIQAVQVGTGGTPLTVYAQTLSGSSVNLDSAIIKNAGGNVIDTIAVTGTVTSTLGTGITVTPTTALTSGSYTVTLISKAAGNFVSPSFTVP